MRDNDTARLKEIRGELDKLISEYGALRSADDEEGEVMVHAWIVCYGATRIDWDDGREQTGQIHADTLYSTRLGLLTNAIDELLKQ